MRLPNLASPCVYFIRRKSDGLIKIGCTRNIRRRFREVQTAGGFAVEWLGCIHDAGQRVELDVHRRFSRARAIGEWFQPTPDLLAFIRESARSTPPPRSRDLAITPALLRKIARHKRNIAQSANAEADRLLMVADQLELQFPVAA